MLRLLLLLVMLVPIVAAAQPARPIPYPVIPPSFFEAAVTNGTRTTTGVPGADYWMNRARYDTEATLRPDQNLLVGRGSVRYWNESPDALEVMYLHLRQNMLRPEALRNWPIQETTEGMEMQLVAVGGTPLQVRPPAAGAGYAVQGTLMRITLPAPLAPGDSVDLSFEWQFTVPEGAPRMGRDSTAFFLGYWYPQIGVYDDLRGWDVEPYRGAGEFYMDFADYDVSIRAPEGWLVAATGLLQNPEEVLSEPVRERLATAATSEEPVSIVSAEQRGAGLATIDADDDTLVWRFTAQQVRDFAFGASPAYVWDAAAAVVGDVGADGTADTALVHALYRPEMGSWGRAAEFGQFTLEHLSGLIMPYPYPQASAVEGPFPFGGIEYPMITLMGGNVPPRPLFEMTAHEFAHNWWPMVVSSNEKRYMWLDEGPTHFATQLAGSAFFQGWNSFNPDALYFESAGEETPIMRHADLYPSIQDLLTAIYPKTKMTFDLIGGLYGEGQALEALRTYTHRWAFRHPSPWDFFNTVEDVIGEDLDWLWTSWFYENWTLDQAVAAVEASDRGLLVTVEDLGLMPTPVPVEVTYADGSVSEQTLPVSAWLAGNRSAVMLFPSGDVSEVVIDPAGALPDVNRENNRWIASQ